MEYLYAATFQYRPSLRMRLSPLLLRNINKPPVHFSRSKKRQILQRWLSSPGPDGQVGEQKRFCGQPTHSKGQEWLSGYGMDLSSLTALYAIAGRRKLPLSNHISDKVITTMVIRSLDNPA